MGYSLLVFALDFRLYPFPILQEEEEEKGEEDVRDVFAVCAMLNVGNAE